MLLPEIVKLLTKLIDVFVMTAPLMPPKSAVRDMNVSIVRVVTPLVVPAATTFTERGYAVSVIVPLNSIRPLESEYHVGVSVNVAVPGSTATVMGCVSEKGLPAHTPAVTVPHRAAS